MRSPPPASFASLTRLAALALALGLALGPACASPDETPCERNSDCYQAYCLEGACRQDCVDSALDCPRGYSCSAIGKCEFDPSQAGAGGESGQGGESGASGQSGAGQSGAGGAGAGGAGQGGAGASQGGAGQAGTGQSGAGQAGAGQGGDGGAGAAGAATGGAGAGGAGAAGAGAGGEPFGPGGSAGAGAGAELDPCGTDADCTSGLLCRSDFKGGDRRCTRPCGTNADCSNGRRCDLVEGTKACVLGDVGRACSVADACNFACLINQKYCTSTCTTGADCPNGYGCAGIGSPPVAVCVKLSAPCDAQDASACIAQAACDTESPLLVSGCTLPCTTAADCPQRAAGLPPWTCDGLCRRPPDVLGPFGGGVTPTQYACNASSQPVNLCNDNQHIDFEAFNIPNPPPVDCSDPFTTPGIATDSCVDSCRYQGGCSWGFACNAVGGINNARIGLCLPYGTAPVGAPCTSGLECSFGYCLATGTCSRDCTVDGLCPTGTTCTAAGGPSAEGKPFRRCQ